MTLPFGSSDRALNIYLTLAQYPILRNRIRVRMRRELFARGITTPQEFEAEVREKAVQSQSREGLHNPLDEEPYDIWETRLERIRDHLTDFYFAYNLPYPLFEQLVREVIAERSADAGEILVSFNPELAPQSMLFEQAQAIENLPPSDRQRLDARLREIKVVLIRTLISDQLAYITIAKQWFTVADLNEIRLRKIGGGKIGGKAAGMLLAQRILNEVGDDAICRALRIPESYFLGSDVMYTFMSLNGLMSWSDQKYKSEDQIRQDYPQIQKEYLAGEFPQDILAELASLLEMLGPAPLIVRSSSLLEDNFGASFAGKYDSVFCPNQASPQENLYALTQAIAYVFASALNPDALLYRRSKGLQDYDERMAILIQVVQGERFGDYYLPHAAGVAFSRNLYRWSQQIRKEDGFARLVWGLGTRAVDRTGSDYPRLVALSHPLLHPESSPRLVRRYSQRYVDLIDLRHNQFTTLPVESVIQPDYPAVRYLAELDAGGYLMPIRSRLIEKDHQHFVLTFDELLRRTPFAAHLRSMVKLLEVHYRAPVDTEFTVHIEDPETLDPQVKITLLQCRPQSHLKEATVNLPANIPSEDIVFMSSRMVPRGHVDDIRYVIFVTPQGYFRLPNEALRAEIGRSIGKLNALLAGQNFICIGPGRWGTRNLDLGVFIAYGDIYHTKALVELAGPGIGPAPEPSFGTHFFQDLVEANIYPLTVYLDDDDAVFNHAFFYDTPNRLLDFLPEAQPLAAALRVIDVSSFRPGALLNLTMDDDLNRLVAYLTPAKTSIAPGGADPDPSQAPPG